ncbi:hypothetical protein BDV93DRAFT_557147 [Ceratobasidium sp. AG-I]|nr:hypothetical protein BDV93DRAFT_557147 [Ceratobasidium sp. AG-I]
MGAASAIGDDFVPSDNEEPPQSQSPVNENEGHWGRPATPDRPGRGRMRSPDSSPVTDTRQRQRRRFANEACDRIGVSAASRIEAIARSQFSTHDLLVLSYIEGLVPKASGSEAMVDFSKSRAFKDFVAPRLNASLLDANIDCYVKGLTACFVKHIRLNFASYGLQRSDLADYHFIKSCTSAVSGALTTHRNEIKSKLLISIETKQDIGSLVQHIVMGNFEVTTEHWHRFAILRDYLLDFQELCRKGTYTTGQFWNFIDAKLQKLRDNLEMFPVPERAKRLKIQNEIVLSADQKKFPFVADPEGLIARPATVVSARFSDVPDWQLACQRALVEMQAYAANEAAAARVAATAAVAAAAAATVADAQALAEEEAEAAAVSRAAVNQAAGASAAA